MLVALALPMAMAETASGAPDCNDPKFADNPACTSDPEPEIGLYDMTMEFIGDAAGLATTCGGAVEMETSDPIDFVSTGVVEIHIREPNYEFDLIHSDPISGYDECHGPAVFPPDDPARQGLLMINNVSDTGFSMMWHFDWYFGEEAHPKNPRKMVAVWEHPSLATAGGEMLDVTNPVTGGIGWDIAADGTRSAIVSGPFDLLVSGSDYDGFVTAGTEELAFLLTLTPKAG
jgi:hypothetical protein